MLFLPQIATSIYTLLDKTMIGLITDNNAEVAYYEQSQTIVKTVMTVITSLGTAMMPRIANLYKNNKRIGSSFTECSKELKFREYNTLELYVTVYFLDAFKSIIPYLTEEFSCKACVYVTFRISFIPITFLTKIIKNI